MGCYDFSGPGHPGSRCNAIHGGLSVPLQSPLAWGTRPVLLLLLPPPPLHPHIITTRVGIRHLA